jgi:ABC-2 type transport system ATP-binding protein
MEEAEQLCDRLAIVDHGRIIALGTLAELRNLLGERDVLRLTGRFDPDAARAATRHVHAADVVHVDADSLIVAIPHASRHLPALFTALGEAGAEVRETVLTQPNLESLFIKLTGRELRE